MLRLSTRKWAKRTDIVCSEDRLKHVFVSNIAVGRGKFATVSEGFSCPIPYCEEAMREGVKLRLLERLTDVLCDEYDEIMLYAPRYDDVYKYASKRILILPDWWVYVPREKNKVGVPYSLRQVADAVALLSLVAGSVVAVMPRRWYLYDETYAGQIAEAFIKSKVLRRRILRFDEPLFHYHNSLEVISYV
jgi:hypothetical protein